MDLQLAGKRAIVSGGGTGIGLAVARELAREGVDVAISGRRAGIVDTAAQLAAETGSRVIGIQTDTGDDDSVRAMVAEAVAQLGGVDILVNTAATAWTADMNKTPSRPPTSWSAAILRSRCSATCARRAPPPRT